jgi:hypothetical protein
MPKQGAARQPPLGLIGAAGSGSTVQRKTAFCQTDRQSSFTRTSASFADWKARVARMRSGATDGRHFA